MFKILQKSLVIIILVVLIKCGLDPKGPEEKCKKIRNSVFEDMCIIPSLFAEKDSLDILLPNCLLLYLEKENCKSK